MLTGVNELVGYAIRSRFPNGDAVATDGDGTPVRLLRIAEGDERGEAALDAWLRADGDHVQRVLDLGTAPNGDLVVVVPDVPIALVDLVAAAPLDAGEALTVLIPIAEAVAALHEAGAAHGALGASAIGLTASGSPVLLMPRTATTASADRGDAQAADRRALAALAARLLPPPVPQQVLAALERDPAGSAVELLFALAEPGPVLLHRSPEGGAGGPLMPARLLAPVRAAPAEGAGRPPRSARRAAVALAGRAVRGAAGVRRRVWIAAGTALAGFVAALVLLPAHDAVVRADPVPPVSVAPVVPSTPRAAPRAAPATPAPSAVPGSMDPARAAAALLGARARCLADRSSRCLDVVDAPGSPVDGADRAALVAGVEAVRPPAVAPVLVRASGATAVLAVGEHTVLEIREPGGWRLRDVIAPTPTRAQIPSEPSKSPSSSRARTADRKRAASAPSTIRWS
jgi:hypothetical protein